MRWLVEQVMHTNEGVAVSPTITLQRNDDGEVIRLELGFIAQFSNEHGTWPGPERSVSLVPSPSIAGGPLNSVDIYYNVDDEAETYVHWEYPHQGNDEDA